MKNRLSYFFIILVLCGAYMPTTNAEQKPMVIVIPSYNNEQWALRNLESVFMQDYANFRVIYIDDCSTDNTFNVVQQYIKQHNVHNKITVIRNPERRGGLYNLYHAIYSCADHEVIVTVDGDDFLADQNVLSHLNGVYTNSNVWMTYGQFRAWPGNGVGWACAIPEKVIRGNTFRRDGAPFTHLRTFYAWLFKKIDKKDLLYKGEFYPMTWDMAMMIPMAEMAGGRFKFIDRVLYIWNGKNPINDHKVNNALQSALSDEIRGKKPYEPLQEIVLVR